MKKAILAIVIVLIGLFFWIQRAPTPQPITIKVRDTQVTVDLAKTDEQIQKGLGGTTSLPENHGMLFVFPQMDQPRVFWMKNMVIPIDIIWISDGKIVQIDANVPPPASSNVPDSALKLYPSNQPVDYVLEMAAGWAQEHASVGDIVDLGDLD